VARGSGRALPVAWGWGRASRDPVRARVPAPVAGTPAQGNRFAASLPPAREHGLARAVRGGSRRATGTGGPLLTPGRTLRAARGMRGEDGPTRARSAQGFTKPSRRLPPRATAPPPHPRPCASTGSARPPPRAGASRRPRPGAARGLRAGRGEPWPVPGKRPRVLHGDTRHAQPPRRLTSARARVRARARRSGGLSSCRRHGRSPSPRGGRFAPPAAGPCPWLRGAEERTMPRSAQGSTFPS